MVTAIRMAHPAALAVPALKVVPVCKAAPAVPVTVLK